MFVVSSLSSVSVIEVMLFSPIGEDGQGFQFARPAAGKKAASLLGCTLLELSKSVFGKNQSNERYLRDLFLSFNSSY